MKFIIDISKQAAADLRSIFEYIDFTLRSLQSAEKQLTRLEKSVFSLEQMPDRFRLYDKEPWYSRGLHTMSIDRYLIFYLIDHDMHTVHIMRIIYGGRNIDVQLQETAE